MMKFHYMKKLFPAVLAAGFFCFLPMPAAGVPSEGGKAFLIPLQERDSVLIADHLMYGFEMNVAEGTGISLPDYSEGFCDGIFVVSPWQVDTVKVRRQGKEKPKLLDIKGRIVITSFDEGEYSLPPIAVQRTFADGTVDTLLFEPAGLDVKTMPVDTATFEVHDIKGQIRYPLTFRELFPYILGFQLLAVLAVLAVALTMMHRRRKSGESASREPAHIVALRKLDRYRGSKLWAADKQKAFYSGITDTLREYIAARYGISALEMTTKEIFDGLSAKELPEDLYGDMKSLFERADFVKFAKYTASDDENASAIPSAVRFVTRTYQEELDGEADQKRNDDVTVKQEG